MGTYEGMTVEVVWDTPGNTNFNYTANATDELIQGYGGADWIYGNALDNYIFGDQRRDITDRDATPDGADVLYGYGGDDVIDPGSGTGNYVNGGSDIDTLDYRFVTPGQTLIVDMELGTADAGTYGTTSFVNMENVFGSLYGPNFLYGDAGDNVFYGGYYDDEIKGRDGSDSIYGYAGDDELRGGAGNDHIQGGRGHDLIVASRGGDTVIGGQGHDTLEGGRGRDKIDGSSGRDRILGEEGNDKLEGGNGRDTLIAGSGSDRLIGGAKADRFVFDKHSDSNRILDFESIDVIKIKSGANSFSDLDFYDTKGGLRIEFGNVEIFLKGLDLFDIDAGNFVF